MLYFIEELQDLGYDVEKCSIGMWQVTKDGQEYLVETQGTGDKIYCVYELINDKDSWVYDELNQKTKDLDIILITELQIANLIQERYYENCSY